MSASEKTQNDLEDEELALGEDGVTRLLDIVTQEVSLVDRAANKRKWLIRKGMETMPGDGHEVFETEDGKLTTDTDLEQAEDGETLVEKQMTMPGPVKAAVLSAVEAAHGRATKLADHLKSMSEDDSVKGMPSELGTEIKGIATALRAISSKYPAPKAKSEDDEASEEETDDTTAKGEVDTETTEELFDTEKASKSISSGVKSKAMAAAEDAVSRLASLASQVKAAEEGDDMPQPLPPAVAKELEAIAMVLEGVVSAYPSPKAEKVEDGNSDTQPPHTTHTTDTDPLTSTEGEKDVSKVSTFDAMKEVKSVLGVVMSKLEPGKPIDEDSYQKLDKLRALVNSAGPQKDEEEASDKGEVKKAGAKMALKRRKRFEEAIKSLLSLFKEVMPKTDLGKFPHLAVSKAETETTELREKLTKAEGDLSVVRKELSELKERPVDSLVVQDVNTIPSGKGDEAVSWPLDLNSE